MRTRIPALKVSIYILDGESHRGVPLSSAILNFLFYRGIQNALATRAAAGFGADHTMRSSSFVEISDRLPVLIQFVDTAEKIGCLMDKLEELVGDGTIELQETTILERPSVPAPVRRATMHLAGPALMLTLYITEGDRWNGLPLHQALVDAFRSNDVSGVTVTRGIVGFGASKDIHKERVFHLSSDRPIIVTVVETQEKIEQLKPLLDRMIEHGLAVISGSTVVAYSHRAAPISDTKRATHED